MFMYAMTQKHNEEQDTFLSEFLYSNAYLIYKEAYSISIKIKMATVDV